MEKIQVQRRKLACEIYNKQQTNVKRIINNTQGRKEEQHARRNSIRIYTKERSKMMQFIF